MILLSRSDAIHANPGILSPDSNQTWKFAASVHGKAENRHLHCLERAASVVEYVARYTHKIAITDARILQVDDE